MLEELKQTIDTLIDNITERLDSNSEKLEQSAQKIIDLNQIIMAKDKEIHHLKQQINSERNEFMTKLQIQNKKKKKVKFLGLF